MTELMLKRGGHRELDEIAVAEAMHPGVLMCRLETSLRDVARMMSLYRIHAVVAYGDDSDGVEEPGLWGVVSDLDLVQAAVAGRLEDLTARGTAVTPAIQVHPDDSLQHAAQLMTQHDVTHLIVADRTSGAPVGVLSTLDVARALAEW